MRIKLMSSIDDCRSSKTPQTEPTSVYSEYDWRSIITVGIHIWLICCSQRECARVLPPFFSFKLTSYVHRKGEREKTHCKIAFAEFACTTDDSSHFCAFTLCCAIYLVCCAIFLCVCVMSSGVFFLFVVVTVSLNSWCVSMYRGCFSSSANRRKMSIL